MDFTTHLELHSQTTRLFENVSGSARAGADGALTLSGNPFQGIWAPPSAENASLDYNSGGIAARFPSWAIPCSLAVTRGILVSFFSSA